MEIHNLMEDAVQRAVDEICDDEERNGKSRYCTSDECRLDAICYVLNRIPPHYVTSSRGLAHSSSDIENDQQLQVDVMRLAQEGLSRVTSVRRNYYAESAEKAAPPGEGPCFNFPTIKGRVFNGRSFEPIYDVEVLLLLDGEPARMFDSRWQNPYAIVFNTPGTFIFWPAPIPTESPEQERTFQCELRIEDEEYEEFRHFFTLALRSDARFAGTFTYNRDYLLQDLYIFPAKSIG
ncbi:MAG: late competence development ComFB family protein [Alkalispirochaetaceae bacterium]